MLNRSDWEEWVKQKSVKKVLKRVKNVQKRLKTFENMWPVARFSALVTREQKTEGRRQRAFAIFDFRFEISN